MVSSLKYPYLYKILLVCRSLKISFDTWNELELCYLLNKKNFKWLLS